MDFEKEILPTAFEHLKSRPLTEEERQHFHWKREARFALQSHLSQKEIIDADDALVWACLETYEGRKHDTAAFNDEFERKQEALKQALMDICEPGTVSLVIARQEQDDEDEEGFEDDREDKLRSLYQDSDTLMLDGTTLSGVASVSFSVPAKSGARRETGSRSSVPAATIWLSHPGMADNNEHSKAMCGIFGAMLGLNHESENDTLHEEDQDDEAFSDRMRGDVARTGMDIDGEAHRGARMHHVEVDLALLTDRVINAQTPITPELLDSILQEGGYVVTGQGAIANLMLALDPERCTIPTVHEVPETLPTDDNFEEINELRKQLENDPFQQLLNQYLADAAAIFESRKGPGSFVGIGDLSVSNSRLVPFLGYIDTSETKGTLDLQSGEPLVYKAELAEDFQIVHDILLDLEKQKRQLLQRGVARLLRNGRDFRQEYSDQDKYTGVLLGEHGVAVRNIVETERDHHVEAVLNVITKDIFLSIFSGVDPFETARDIDQHSRDMLSEVSKIHGHYKRYFDIPSESLDEVHKLIKDKLQGAVEHARLSVERLGDVVLRRFEELKDDSEIKDEFGEHNWDDDE